MGKRAGNRLPTVTSSRAEMVRDRGKEKLEGYGVNTSYKNAQTSRATMEMPGHDPKIANVQMLSTINTVSNGDIVMLHRSEERNMIPDPPDDTVWMVEEENGENDIQDTQAGDSLMEEGEVRGTHPC